MRALRHTEGPENYRHVIEQYRSADGEELVSHPSHALHVSVEFPESRKCERTAGACADGAMNMQTLEACPER